jgi:hypothetical protein
MLTVLAVALSVLAAPTYAKDAGDAAIANCWGYSNMKRDAEHTYGESFSLWEVGGKLEGLTEAQCGLSGDPSRSPIEDASIDASGVVTFSAAWTLGRRLDHGTKRWVPAKTRMKFYGKKLPDRIKGKLTFVEGSSCRDLGKGEIALKKETDCSGYKWNREAFEKMRAPKKDVPGR